MPEDQSWRWTFLGFQSASDDRPVQTWFDGLPDKDRDEIKDLLVHMQNITNRLWRKPEFDPLEGAGGISEIRCDIRDERGVVNYRLYGYFGPGEREYTFLHGICKKVRNDYDGKRIAKDRLHQIGYGATVHKFSFERGFVVKIKRERPN